MSDKTKIAEFYRKLLKLQLAELMHCLGLEQLEREDLDKAALRAISKRFDRLLNILTGTSERERSLVWLDEAVRELALKLKGQSRGRGSPLDVVRDDVLAMMQEIGVEVALGPNTTKGLIGIAGDDDFAFVAESVIRIPWYNEPITPELAELVHAYCDLLLRPPRRGRRRRGGAAQRTRAEAFFELAKALNLVSARATADGLQRVLRGAKRKLRASPLRNGGS